MSGTLPCVLGDLQAGDGAEQGHARDLEVHVGGRFREEFLGAPLSQDDYRNLEVASSTLGSSLARLLMDLRRAVPS